MSEQSKAPDVIWANVISVGDGQPLTGEWNYCDTNNPEDTEYVSRDHCKALMVAAYEAACKALCFGGGVNYNSYRIRQLTSADAQAAYDAALSAARAEVLAEAMALFTKDETLPGCVVLHRLEQLRGKNDG